jgi:hypothetical protein
MCSLNALLRSTYRCTTAASAAVLLHTACVSIVQTRVRMHVVSIIHTALCVQR